MIYSNNQLLLAQARPTMLAFTSIYTGPDMHMHGAMDADHDHVCISMHETHNIDHDHDHECLYTCIMLIQKCSDCEL